MKKMFGATAIIIVCAALCASLRTPAKEIEAVPTEAYTTAVSTEPIAPLAMDSTMMTTVPPEATPPITCEARLIAPESVQVTTDKEESSAEPLSAETFSQTAQETPTVLVEPTPATQTATTSSDSYHTDVYPNNVYTEELIYDADGNLIGKTTTYPTAFGSDTIWIDGRAYYNLPGFGLIEWSGPSRRTEDYTMYESGVKVGIMGGENEAPASSTPADHPTELPIPIDETIDQTITVRPERNSTPPDYKPNLTPPADSNARDSE